LGGKVARLESFFWGDNLIMERMVISDLWFLKKRWEITIGMWEEQKIDSHLL